MAWALGGAMKTNEFFREAKAAVAARNLPLALRLVESAIRLDGEQAEFHALQASLLEETHGDRRMLIRALESAIRLNPGDVSCTVRLALACQALGMHSKATRLWNVVQKLAPNHPVFRSALGAGGGNERALRSGGPLVALVASARGMVQRLFKRGAR